MGATRGDLPGIAPDPVEAVEGCRQGAGPWRRSYGPEYSPTGIVPKVEGVHEPVWMKAVTYAGAVVAVGVAASVCTSIGKWKLRRALRMGRVRPEHVETLLVIVERGAQQKATRTSHVAEHLGVEPEVARTLLREVRNFGCAQHSLFSYKPAASGIEFLQSIEAAEICQRAQQVLEDQERLGRMAALAHMNVCGDGLDGAGS